MGRKERSRRLAKWPIMTMRLMKKLLQLEHQQKLPPQEKVRYVVCYFSYCVSFVTFNERIFQFRTPTLLKWGCFSSAGLNTVKVDIWKTQDYFRKKTGIFICLIKIKIKIIYPRAKGPTQELYSSSRQTAVVPVLKNYMQFFGYFSGLGNNAPPSRNEHGSWWADSKDLYSS